MHPIYWIAAAALFAFLFVAMWSMASRHLLEQARMVKDLGFDPGAALRVSDWGSGWVNGVPMQRCVKVQEHVDGWLIRVLPLFGGGKLWLPRQSLTISALSGGNSIFARPTRTLTCDGHEVRLYGGLAQFVA